MFEQSASFRHPQKVYNVVPGDFNNDGRLDVLVMSQSQKQDETSMAVYFSDLQGGFGAYYASLLNVNQLPSSSIYTDPNPPFHKFTTNLG